MLMAIKRRLMIAVIGATNEAAEADVDNGERGAAASEIDAADVADCGGAEATAELIGCGGAVSRDGAAGEAGCGAA